MQGYASLTRSTRSDFVEAVEQANTDSLKRRLTRSTRSDFVEAGSVGSCQPKKTA